MGFLYEEDWVDGEFGGKHYDYVQRKILVDHIAVGVPNPRDPMCTLGVDEMLNSSAKIKIAVDPEETEEKIHVPVIENQGQFGTCRTTDFDGKLPTGVQVVYCRCKGRDEWAVQKYIFDKQAWTMEKAQAWVKAHRDAVEEEEWQREAAQLKAKGAEAKVDSHDVVGELARSRVLLQFLR